MTGAQVRFAEQFSCEKIQGYSSSYRQLVMATLPAPLGPDPPTPAKRISGKNYIGDLRARLYVLERSCAARVLLAKMGRSLNIA